MPRLYHPNLEPPANEAEVPDDEGVIAVLAESGWKVAPEPEAKPGYAPEPVTYEPVKPKRRGADSKPSGEDKPDT